MANGFQHARTVVVKLGSAVLTQAESAGLDIAVLEGVCSEVASHIKAGRQIIIVTSGAVAAGRGVLNIWDRKPTIAVKQALAAVGQSRLMQIYSDLFARHGVVVGQMLLSLSDMENRKRYVNARYTLEELLQRGCVPIINENDTVTVDELKFGDNDGLAAMVAVKMQADALLLLSDVDGLYDSNPKTNPDAKLLPVVEKVTVEVMRAVNDGGAGKMIQVGTGGMETKLHAARMATASGVGTIIAQGKRAGVISEVLSGASTGTFFPPVECHRSRREKWILSGKTQGRSLALDAGACEALTVKKKSLLAAGVRDVTGNFQPMDVVEILDADGQLLGKGVTNYSADQLRRIMGKKSGEIEKILGAKTYDEVVHRDNLALF
jgi:glutamate 5-kinase